MASHAILKNKGKQKANGTEPDLGGQENEDFAVLVIKFSDSSIPDLTLEVESVKTTTVSSIRREIRNSVGGKMLNRRLRLIRNGRVLNDKVDMYQEIFGANSAVSKGAGDNPRVYIHCSIGDILSQTELAKENEYDQKAPTRSTLPELRGFDRLQNSGFSDEDIAQLRQQFGRLHGYGTNEDMTRMEEQWIDTGVQDGPTDVSLGGDYVDDLIGILVGMFLGVFALFFLKESNIFSKRQQKSMVAGIIVNFSFALLRNLM